MNLDSTDQALVAAAHAGDHTALLVLADKKQEEGHEDFAHLLRAGVNHGAVGTGLHGVRDQRVPLVYAPDYDNTEGGTHGRMRFWLNNGTLLRIHIPLHHPDYREMMESVTRKPAPFGNHRVLWEGHNPVWLETPQQLERLRAFHGKEPSSPQHLSIHHGPDGIYGVLPSSPRSWKDSRPGHFIRRLTNSGAYNGIEGPYDSREEAEQAAKKLSGRTDIDEVAQQYQKALSLLS